MIRFKHVDEAPKGAPSPKDEAKKTAAKQPPAAIVEDADAETGDKAASIKALPAARKRKFGKG